MCSSAANTHIKLLDRSGSGARFLIGAVFECDNAHRRSIAVLCMRYKIRCQAMHPLNAALPGPYVSLRVTRGALIAHRYTYAPPRCRTAFSPSQCLSGTILLTAYSMVWDRRVSRAGLMPFYWPKLLYHYYVFYYYFLSLLSIYRLVLWGWGLRTDRVYTTLSQPCTVELF